MKKAILAILAASAVTLGGCHVFKQPQTAKSVLAAERKSVLSLESLDLRVSAIEHRLDAAKAWRAQQAAKRAAEGQR